MPVAYVKRPLLTGDDNDVPVEANILDPRHFNPGGRLFIRARAAGDAAEMDITSSQFGADELYDVKDLTTSFDGRKLLFSMRAPLIEGVDEDVPPTHLNTGNTI